MIVRTPKLLRQTLALLATTAVHDPFPTTEMLSYTATDGDALLDQLPPLDLVYEISRSGSGRSCADVSRQLRRHTFLQVGLAYDRQCRGEQNERTVELTHLSDDGELRSPIARYEREMTLVDEDPP
ncbi:hypothetical protein CLAFUW4_07743 [Fulvia fulva]|uniref:uncharacterized protein n=1 Tax=Passalora fulva TaxID=5499 RepID=UPI002852752C|nr:uncharacterized protein CLAFUR5_20243 [Fulvia fulva]KAK4629021.1 hypothetical protein CLAFUR4_07748 [Fulvia fulva]KAK4630081.1 hypothetical protein CLAFUR0_07746 [Fulvia fulva]WMI38814.1 hypothetical protein CLAFUR5_20243 [Fulvia fulva]WPV13004.1 hypothetical protein CLAFUW4_07743 [Fulvia fulva]WPV27179.1 hypothetical protein CLAFUW7_07744 [Fulvia fulva]